MMFAGTVVNGTIVLDGPIRLPEGTRVRVGLTNEIGLPVEPYNREKELALLGM